MTLAVGRWRTREIGRASTKFSPMVGGAPVTAKWAETIGADAYGTDAAEAAAKARKLLQAS